MKAICVHEFGAPEVMHYEDVDPLIPQPGEILIEVKAIGVNPVDAYMRSGTYAVKPKCPFTPGFDVAGIVKAVGFGVSNMKIGQTVYTDGTITGAYADEVICIEQQVHSLPAALSMEQGAALGIPYTTAFRALFFKAKAFGGETVLIHGASGGVGTAAIQLAKTSRLTVLATAGTDAGCKHCSAQGADAVFDHTKDGYVQQIMDATNGAGVSIILEMRADKNLGKDLTLLNKHGRVVVIGSRGDVQINPRDLMKTDGIIHGMVIFNASAGEKNTAYEMLASIIEQNNLKPVIGKTFALKDAAAAHHAIMNEPACGKIILIP